MGALQRRNGAQKKKIYIYKNSIQIPISGFKIISKEKFDVLDYNTLSMYDIISHFHPIGTLELKSKWI